MALDLDSQPKLIFTLDLGCCLPYSYKAGSSKIIGIVGEPGKLKIDPGLGTLNLPLYLYLLPPSILLLASLSLSYKAINWAFL